MTYAQAYAQALTAKFPSSVYSVEPGKKYDRIVRQSRAFPLSAYAFAFVERETGVLLKAAGYKTPAKGARGYLGSPEGFSSALERADELGRDLYAR